MNGWTICAIAGASCLIACSPDDEITSEPEQSAQYRIPIRTPPWLADFKLGSTLGRDGVLAHAQDDFTPGEPIYLTMKINDAPRATVVETSWYGPSDRTLVYELKTISSGQQRLRFVADNTLDWQAGAYRAEVWIGHTKVREMHFDIVSE